MSSATSQSKHEATPLLSPTDHSNTRHTTEDDPSHHHASSVYKRQVRRSWAIAIASVVFGLAAVIAVIAEGTTLDFTSHTELQPASTQPFTQRVIFLFVFVGCCGAVAFAMGVFVMVSLSGAAAHSESKLVWASFDLHGLASGGLALGAVSAIASLIAIIGFQSHDTGKPFSFNITSTTGWVIIGSLVLFLLGVFSAAELDFRHLAGRFDHTRVAKIRTIGTLQLVFGFAVFAHAAALFGIIKYNDAIQIMAAVLTGLTSLLSFAASRTILKTINRASWPLHFNTPEFDHAWGLSVGAHCVGMVATGLVIYLGTDAIYNCYSNHDTKLYRPNCDSEIGSLAAVIPHIFTAVTLIMLGITNLFGAIRVAKLVFELTHTSDSPRHKHAINEDRADVQQVQQNTRVVVDKAQPRVFSIEPEELAELFEKALPGSGSGILDQRMSGRMLHFMLQSSPDHGQATSQATIDILVAASNKTMNKVDAARILGVINPLRQ